MNKVEKYSTKRIIYTGGEPAMQKLRPLSDELHSKGYNIAIETNGTIELEEGLVDWICVSPKNMIHPEFPIKQTEGHELKVVYTGQDLSMYDELKEHGEKGEAIRMKSIFITLEKSMNHKKYADQGTSNVKFNAALICMNPNKIRMRLPNFNNGSLLASNSPALSPVTSAS